MNNRISLEARLRFRNWLRGELRSLDFWVKFPEPEGHYLMREFSKYCDEHGAPIDEASCGRYLRDDIPVVPTAERCRVLAKVLDMDPLVVLLMAGYVRPDELVGVLSIAEAQRELPVDLDELVKALNVLYRSKHSNQGAKK